MLIVAPLISMSSLMLSSRSRVARADRVHDDVVAGRAGDVHIPREILESQRPAAGNRDRAVHGFGFLSLSGGRTGGQVSSNMASAVFLIVLA